MPRLSLDSPASKLLHHAYYSGARGDEGKVMPASSNSAEYCDDDREGKWTKPRRLAMQSEKFIHFIPLLTLFCFLVLYLTSHAPSQSDLAHFEGFKLPVKHLAFSEAADGSLDPRRGGILAIRSLRSLGNTATVDLRTRLPRKIADFQGLPRSTSL